MELVERRVGARSHGRAVSRVAVAWVNIGPITSASACVYTLTVIDSTYASRR